MENPSLIDDTFGTFSFNDNIRSYLSQTAKWAKFLSIIGFIYIGLMVIFGVFAGSIFGVLFRQIPEFNAFMSPVILTVMYFFFALVFFFPVLYLFRFSEGMQKALRSDDEASLTSAFMNLKSHYQFIGIVTIIVIGLYVLLFLFSMIIAVAAL